MPDLVGVLGRRGARWPRGTFAEALHAVPPSGAGPPAAASGSWPDPPRADTSINAIPVDALLMQLSARPTSRLPQAIR